ncbi:MAG TPA: FtsX-like permease family protein, partial [Streptomyces sp.]|nr:FtsX-like permease family protein [Streptomyces sp.]
RAVSGITIAVAGAIALQMLFAVVEDTQTTPARQQGNTAEADIYGPRSTVAGAEALTAELRRTEGVRKARGHLSSYGEVKGIDDGVSIVVGSCSTLRELARIGDCRDGEAFIAPPVKEEGPAVKRGNSVLLDPDGKGKDRWRVPQSARTVEGRSRPEAGEVSGLLLTPSVLSEKRLSVPAYQGSVVGDHDSEALERVRTTVFKADPSYSIFEVNEPTVAKQFTTIRRAVLAAAVAVLLLIGASMVVSMLEQLRERKRQLSVLVAFGTKRSTLGASVLWQTAVPVTLGIGLAVVFGLGLGWGLLRLLGAPSTNWLVFLPVAGAGAGVIALVTIVSLPFLWRLMRPDGLRTE